MAFYGLSTNPILKRLQQEIPTISQVWLADDATGAGKLEALRKWWDTIQSVGKRFGYFVKPSKSWIVLKDPGKKEQCEKLFQTSPINITLDGKRHLGAAIGSPEFKNKYIDGKVTNWITNIKTLSEIAKSQPHAAYAAFIHGEQHKYTYFKRTITDISENLKPLDDAIDNFLVPSLFGCEINDNERKIISLPIKDGGLGIRKVGEDGDKSYETSIKVTLPLTTQIHNQSDELPNVDVVRNAKNDAIREVKTFQSERTLNIKNMQSSETQRSLEQLSEPGASSWLGALPLETQGFNLTKGEFQDALALRYQKQIKNLPSKCPCGKNFDTTHAMNCHRGGFVNARHDNIRDMECTLLKSVVHDVECEPSLQPVVNKSGYRPSAILEDEARLDIRARGFWRQGQNSYFDVCVTNADCSSQRDSTVKSILRNHEQRKKRGYNRRVMEVEHGSFTPLIFTTTGVMSHECSIFHKALAEKISIKRGERYEDIMRYLRVKLSYLALKSTLLCLRGSRSHTKPKVTTNEDFGLALNELGM